MTESKLWGEEGYVSSVKEDAHYAKFDAKQIFRESSPFLASRVLEEYPLNDGGFPVSGDHLTRHQQKE